MTGPAGVPCPVCGHYVNVFGCTPGACKDPERATRNCSDCRRPFSDPPYIRSGEGAMRCPSAEHNAIWEKTRRPDLAPAPAAPEASQPFIASRPELGAPPLPRPQCLRAGCTRPAKQDANHGPHRKFCEEHEPPAAAEAPASWRWARVAGAWELVVGGRLVLRSLDDDLAPRVRALTELAPEMEALLREEIKGAVCILVPRDAVGRRDIRPDEMCPAGEECWWCRVRALLARIDDRSKGG